jgi:ATP-dependent DNA ligase
MLLVRFDNFIYFYPEKPTLVHRDQELVDELSDNPDFVAEPKYNGTRCIVVVLNGDVAFWTRHNHPVKNLKTGTPEYNELVQEIKIRVPDKGHFQFEGELRHSKVTGIQYKIVLWDCLIYDGEYLNKLTYDERRELVEKHFQTASDASGKVISILPYLKRVKVIEQFKGDFRAIFNEYVAGQRRLGEPEEFEGLVMKNRNGKLALGRRTNPDSRWMFKIRIETGRHKF